MRFGDKRGDEVSLPYFGSPLDFFFSVGLFVLPYVLLIQVGAYFLKNYYPILQQKPELVHQFYTELSSMVRFDGTDTESATGMTVLLTNLSYFSFFFFDEFPSL